MALVPRIDGQRLWRDHQRFLSSLRSGILLAFATAEQHVHDHVRLYSKFKRRSARSLKDAARAKHTGSWNSRVIRFQSYVKDVAYAEPIEYGARPHKIRARRAKALRFQWKKLGGQTVFFKSVQHPGNRPYKFLWTATHSAWRVLGEALEQGIATAAKRF